MRPRLAHRLSPLLFLALLFVIAPSAGAETTRITFLHVNDTYRMRPQNGWGGLTTLSTLLKRERARAPNAIFTHGGDLISPSLMSGLTKGAHMIDLMNRLKLDVAVLGNHEFDFGLDVLGARIGQSKFPWLGANVSGRQPSTPTGWRNLWTRKVGPFRVGIIGVVTPKSQQYIRGTVPVAFGSPQAAVRLVLADFKDQGSRKPVDVIVALTHMDLDEDRALARAFPEIDLILGGHEHIPIARMEGRTLIFKAGSDADWLGVVTLDVVREKGRTRPTTASRPTPPSSPWPDATRRG